MRHTGQRKVQNIPPNRASKQQNAHAHQEKFINKTREINRHLWIECVILSMENKKKDTHDRLISRKIYMDTFDIFFFSLCHIQYSIKTYILYILKYMDKFVVDERRGVEARWLQFEVRESTGAQHTTLKCLFIRGGGGGVEKNKLIR